MKIFVFGDSIAQGRSDPEFFGWVNRLAVWSQQEAIRTDWEIAHLVCNMGNAGDLTTDILKRFQQEFIWRRGREDSLVIFQVGINDVAHRVEQNQTEVPLEQFQKNYQELLQQAKGLAQHVVVLGLTRVDELKVNSYTDCSSARSWMNKNIEQYNEMLKSITAKADVLYISLFDTVYPQLFVDGLHPNATGHQLIFERVKGELEKVGIL